MSEPTAESATKHRRHRVFNLPNLAFVVTTGALFIIVVYLFQTNLAVLVGAIVASAAGALVWWAGTSLQSRNRMSKVLANLPMLGAIPTHRSVPAPTLTDSDVLSAYGDAFTAMEGQTNGRVLLVSSAERGTGASTVAMNLAISATRSGRRVVLIDGDTADAGVSRYMSSGSSPGMTDIAAGESTLAETARMWAISETASLPVVPSGEPISDVTMLGGINVSDAIESIADRADFVLVDAPSALVAESTAHLATHADGTILVVADDADPSLVADVGAKLSEISAPILGYVIIRADKLLIPFVPLRKRFALRVAVGALVLLGAFTAITGAQILDSWNSVEREEFALADAKAILAGDDTTTTSTSANASTTTTTAAVVAEDASTTTIVPQNADEPYRTFLMIGGDEDSGASDVILYVVMPTNGTDPFMMSFPRDLYVDNPCTGGKTRINALSHGCRDKGINGGTLLSVQISEMTGIDVDHFAEFTFDGFVDIIDAVGGVEICVGDYAVRDLPNAHLELPAGCTDATGTQALSWVRSRHTQILKDGTWRSMPGTGDLMRNTHQQDVIFELASELQAFESPKQLTQTVASVADAFTLSDTLSLTDAISLAWSLRGIDVEEINRVVIPVKLSRSPANQSILIATAPIKEVIAEVYGDSLPAEIRES